MNAKVQEIKYRIWAAQLVQKRRNQTKFLSNMLPWWLFHHISIFWAEDSGDGAWGWGRHVCVCQQRVGAVIVPLRGVEVLAVLEPWCQSPRPPSISHIMTFMLDLSFTRIVTQTTEKRTERSAKRDGERPDLQLHLARAAVCCVWRRI